MEKFANRRKRLRFVHIFIVAASLIFLVNFAISGFAPYFMVLIPAFPFLLLAVIPISWEFVRDSEKLESLGLESAHSHPFFLALLFLPTICLLVGVVVLI
jgi:hypothetical protein